MRSIPDENELYKKFDARGHQMIPGALMPYFEEDVHELVTELKKIIEYTLSGDDSAFFDVDDKIVRRLEIWRNSKEKIIAYESYKGFIADNSLVGESLTFENFISNPYYSRWENIKALGIKAGSRIRVSGYGDELIVREISPYLTLCVEGLSKYIDPSKILAVL